MLPIFILDADRFGCNCEGCFFLAPPPPASGERNEARLAGVAPFLDDPCFCCFVDFSLALGVTVLADSCFWLCFCCFDDEAEREGNKLAFLPFFSPVCFGGLTQPEACGAAWTAGAALALPQDDEDGRVVEEIVDFVSVLAAASFALQVGKADSLGDILDFASAGTTCAAQGFGFLA